MLEYLFLSKDKHDSFVDRLRRREGDLWKLNNNIYFEYDNI